MPVAIEHERPGTTTNVEGRVTRLGQKLVAPGEAWPDWMIAAELAAELGADLGFASAEDVWAEIERLAPLFAGMTAAALEAPAAHDGLLAPLRPAGAGRVLPVDPAATPGVESVERQGAPPRVGLAVPPGPAAPGRPALARARGDAPSPGAGLEGAVAVADPPHLPPPDSYSLRLVSTRRLYDRGNAVSHSPSLVPLVPEAELRAHPHDLDRLGARDGDRVVVRSSQGSLVLPCAPDATLARGVVAVDFNLEGGGAANAAAALIDAGAPVTDVRLESAP